MEKSKEKILGMPLRILISILIIGSLFKIQHWPYADLIMVSAFSLIAILYTFRFFYKNDKVVLDSVKVVLVFFWAVNGIITVMHWPFKVFFQPVVIVAFLCWSIMKLLNYFGDNNAKELAVTRQTIVLFSLATLLISAGAALKVMHWPGATFLIVAGMILGIFRILKRGL